uniref:Uncharacterized protein n=1 Tax=Romanomermis culicivorax TaxID=13658 RepID=A0A915I268_ROMCU
MKRENSTERHLIVLQKVIFLQPKNIVYALLTRLCRSGIVSVTLRIVKGNVIGAAGVASHLTLFAGHIAEPENLFFRSCALSLAMSAASASLPTGLEDDSTKQACIWVWMKYNLVQ